METTLSAPAIPKINTNDKTESRKNILEMLEFNRFGVIAFVLAIVACTSGITAGFFVDGASQLDLTLVALPTMLTLCSILIVAPIRWIIGIGLAAMLIDLAIILF
jgi:hypothetical protein